MATRIFNSEDVELQDGKDVTLQPAVLGRLRRIMAAWEGFKNVENDDEGFDVLLNCAGIALEPNFEDQFDTLKASAADQKKGAFLAPEYKQYLEDTLDIDTIYKILDITAGIKMNDPKLLEAAMEAARNSEQATE